MVTTITLPSSNFTDRDFDSWIIELRSRVASAFPVWTDFNTANFGNILLEMYAHTLDVASYYQDQQFRETRVIFARLRRSMIGLGKNLGFVLPSAVPATADLELTIADGDPRLADLLVPKGTRVETADGTATFETLADATIPAGSIQITGVSAENAFAESDVVVAPGIPNFSFPLSATPYVDSSAAATFGVDAWTLVVDFYNSGPADKVFRVDVDDQDRGTAVFGDGVNGAIPAGSGSITYKTGGGSSGNVEGNALDTFPDGARFPTDTGEQVTLEVRNPSGAGGGVDRMSVEEARIAIPAFVRTAGQRSITHQDFEDNARKVRGVARAMILTADDANTIPENTGEIYVIPVGGGLPSGALKTEVSDTISNTYPPPLTFTFSVEDPTLKIVSIAARVFLARNVSHADARAAIETALDSLFSLVTDAGAPNPLVDFGFKIRTQVMPAGTLQAVMPFSDLFDAVRNAETPTGLRVLREVDKNTFAPGLDVDLADVEFPVLGSVTLTDADTNASF